jgi:hypothetical protein
MNSNREQTFTPEQMNTAQEVKAIFICTMTFVLCCLVWALSPLVLN